MPKSLKEDFKEEVQFLWLFFTDCLLEPILFAFVLVLLFSRIQAIIERASSIPNFDFGKAVYLDMANNLWIYIAFGILFAIWVAVKAVRRRDEQRQHKAIMESLSTLTKTLAAIAEKLNGNNKG